MSSEDGEPPLVGSGDIVLASKQAGLVGLRNLGNTSRAGPGGREFRPRNPAALPSLCTAAAK
jgi:hypothetical protein